MKVGENPKMPYPQCGRGIKIYAWGNNDAPSITKYGSLVRKSRTVRAWHTHSSSSDKPSAPFPLPCAKACAKKKAVERAVGALRRFLQMLSHFLSIFRTAKVAVTRTRISLCYSTRPAPRRAAACSVKGRYHNASDAADFVGGICWSAWHIIAVPCTAHGPTFRNRADLHYPPSPPLFLFARWTALNDRCGWRLTGG